jgi:hypothetical protein
MPRSDSEFLEHIFARTAPASPVEPYIPVKGECLIFQGYVESRGYGYITRGGRSKGAHRHVYEAARGPIPAGLTVDHLCRSRACVNPDHFEIVTLGENARRGRGNAVTSEQRRTATHCKRGHEFTGARVPNGRRKCEECCRAAWRRWAAKKREQR